MFKATDAKCITETHTRHKDAHRKPTCSVAWRQPLIPCDSGRPGSVLPHRSHSPCTQPRVVSCHRYTTWSPPLPPFSTHTICCPFHITCTQQAFFPALSVHKPFILLAISHHRHTTGSLPLSAQHTNNPYTLCCPFRITNLHNSLSNSKTKLIMDHICLPHIVLVSLTTIMSVPGDSAEVMNQSQLK